MADSQTLRDLFVDALRGAYDAEQQLRKALRKNARAAQHPELAAAFTAHLEETTGQIVLLDEVFVLVERKAKGTHCPAMAGILEEGDDTVKPMKKSPLRDAMLIGGAKRAEHYEIAAYTTLIAMATALGLPDAAGALERILAQEVATDQTLDALATVVLTTVAQPNA